MIKEPVPSDDLKIGLGFSLALHVFIVSVFIIKFFFYSQPVLDLSQAISVNIGELTPDNKLPQKAQEAEEPEAQAPDQMANEKPPAAKTKPREALPKKVEKPAAKEPEISLNKAKQKQKEALNKLKKLSALDQIREDLTKESRPKSPAKTGTKPRVIAAGTALSGLDRMDANAYLGQIDQSIKSAWTLPQWLLNKPFKAQVLVKFNTDGNIISTKIISSSGNSSYDDYCLQAISKAAPFPKVPEKLSEKFSVDGVVVGFPE